MVCYRWGYRPPWGRGPRARLRRRHLSYAGGQLVRHALDLPGERRGENSDGLFRHGGSVQRSLLHRLCYPGLNLLAHITLEVGEYLVLEEREEKGS